MEAYKEQVQSPKIKKEQLVLLQDKVGENFI